MVPSRWVHHKACFPCAWNISFPPQIFWWFPPRFHSFWCLLCQDPCLLFQILWSLDSNSPSLCIKLCYWRFKHVFPWLYLPLTYLLFQTLCRHLISSAPLPHSLGHMELSLLTPYSSRWFFPSSQESVLTRIFCIFFEDVPLATLQRLADVDYPKSLTAMRKILEIDNWSSIHLFGTSATVWTLSHTIFDCIGTDDFDELVPAKILQVCFKLSTMNSSNRLPGCQ